MSDSANPQDPPSASTPQDPFGIEATTTITQNIVINPFGSPEGPQRRSTEWSQNTTNIKLGPGAAASARCEASIGDISADIILRGYGVSEGLGKSIDVPVVLEVDCGNVNINVRDLTQGQNRTSFLALDAKCTGAGNINLSLPRTLAQKAQINAKASCGTISVPKLQEIPRCELLVGTENVIVSGTSQWGLPVRLSEGNETVPKTDIVKLKTSCGDIKAFFKD